MAEMAHDDGALTWQCDCQESRAVDDSEVLRGSVCAHCGGHEKKPGREFYSGVREACEVAPWIPKITDSDLLKECERRRLVSGDMAIVDLARASHSSIRAEAKSRGILCNENHDRMKADAREEGYKRFEGGLIQAMRERDEWRRRAEEAEASNAELTKAHIEYLDTGIPPAEHGCQICGAPEGIDCTPECDDDSVEDEQVRRHPLAWERIRDSYGRPVSLLPPPQEPEPLAFLDEDLLAEDA